MSAGPHPPFGHLLPLMREKAHMALLPPQRQRVALSERSEPKGRVRVAI